jgi:hypothetical protein
LETYIKEFGNLHERIGKIVNFIFSEVLRAPPEKTKTGNLRETFRCNYCDDLIFNSRSSMLTHRVKGVDTISKMLVPRFCAAPTLSLLGPMQS